MSGAPGPAPLRVALLLAGALCGCPRSAPEATLRLRVVDAASGEVVPARVEILDADGEARVAPNAIPLTFECWSAPPPTPLAFLVESDRIENRHTGTTQFYLDAPAQLALPAGRVRLRAFKGIEYRVAEQEVLLAPQRTHDVALALERWADMPAQGWYSADDHLHITRRRHSDDVRIARWMRAEDLHVANLLQMGTVDQFGVTPQPGFGDAGAFRDAETLLLAGQEHPRTHFLGHTITLAADEGIDLRDDYIVYEGFWEASRRAHGLSGYAHHGVGADARFGLALDAPRGGVAFLEVLQFEWPHYDVWYELLDLGLALTPTAGTDFPCGPWSVPGRERFYARLEGPPDRARWREAVRRGRTFVTNGPLLELSIDAAAIGDTLRLDAPGRVRIRARVRFDPARDDVRVVEVLRSGEPIPAPVAEVAAGELRVDVAHDVAGPAWYALRVSGNKRDETPVEPPLPDWMWSVGERITNFREHADGAEAFAASRGRVRPSAAHTAPIWVEVAGRTLASEPRAAERARVALARLDELAARLSDARIDDQALWDWVPYSDAVPVAHLREHRDPLLAAIDEARARYRELLPDRER